MVSCDPLLQRCPFSNSTFERDSQEQKERLQEELEAANQKFIFYPKFNCELIFIENFWCAAKWYVEYTENCVGGIFRKLWIQANRS